MQIKLSSLIKDIKVGDESFIDNQMYVNISVKTNRLKMAWYKLIAPILNLFHIKTEIINDLSKGF